MNWYPLVLCLILIVVLDTLILTGLDTQSNVSSSTSDIVREARQQVEFFNPNADSTAEYTDSGTIAFVLTLFCSWMPYRCSIFVMHQQKSTNAYSLLGLLQPWNLLGRLSHGAVRAVLCILRRITIVFLESESKLIYSPYCKVFNFDITNSSWLLLIMTNTVLCIFCFSQNWVFIYCICLLERCLLLGNDLQKYVLKYISIWPMVIKQI